MSSGTSPNDNSKLAAGYFYALLAFAGWGFFPIYWKFLQHVPSLEILCHRVIWAFVFYCAIIFWREKAWSIYWPQNRKTFWSLTLASALIMANWFVYIYAVNSNQIVESSLGYFINPLVNIVMGIFFLGERLSKTQKAASITAAIGVLIISWDQGHLPWIALFLAFSFAFYGLIKKLNPGPGLQSNQFESLLLLPLSFLLLFFENRIIGASPYPLQADHSFYTGFLLIGGGIITGLPLILFAEAAQRLPFYLLGFFQFLAPSFQFLSGVVIFGEPLSPMKLKGFIFIWGAGVLLMVNGWLVKRARDRAVKPLHKS